MNFGASDVTAGVGLAIKIYQYGFAEENSAGECFSIEKSYLSTQLICSTLR